MNQDIQYLITLHVSGEITPQEQEVLDAAMERNPAIAVELAEAIQLWNLMEAGDASFLPDAGQAWLQMESEITESAPATTVRPIYRRPRFIAAAAAAAVLLATVLFVLPDVLQDRQGRTFSADSGLLDLYLPDSTHVWLNEDSKIAYASDFNSDERRVTLSGEAFFEVRRDEERPFIVQTGQSETRVLGTSFNVRAYEDEETIEVAVESGKVKFSAIEDGNSESLFLRRNERSIYDKETKELEKELRYETGQLAWRHNPDRLSKTTKAPELPVDKPGSLVLPPVKVFVPNRTDKKDVEDYFASSYGIKQNFLKQTVLEIKFKNSSPATTYENIEATVHYSTKRGLKSRILKIDESIRPGDSISVTRRLPDWFVDSKVLSIDVTTIEDL